MIPAVERLIRADSAVLSGRVCAMLEHYAGLEKFRRDVRGHDKELDRDLEQIHLSATAWRISATGTKQAAVPETGTGSEWLSTRDAADHLHLTDRAIRAAIYSKRLDAVQDDGRWRISRESLAHFKARKAIQ